MKQTFAQLLEELETGVRTGRVPEVKTRLGAINSARVPRPYCLAFANLCRRVGLNNIALRILTPVVLKNGKPAQDTSPAERAEYAVLLQRSGAIDEALERLESLSNSNLPEVFLFQAFCKFNRWEYFEAVPVLRRYLSFELPPYQNLIGKVNLAAALAAIDSGDEALELLKENIERPHQGGFHRLAANCYEIRAQVHLMQNHIDLAEADLNEAFQTLKDENTTAELSILKWKAVIESRRADSTGALKNFRVLAVNAGEWEAVRHTDLHILKINFTKQLFDFHLFGSPWLAYRDRAQRELSRIVDSEYFDYGAEGQHLLDLRSGTVDGREVLNPGSKPHIALTTLLRDFYRPVPVGTMFRSLFPKEHFNAFSSPNRVHQVLYRLRNWATENDLPLEIDQDKEGYSLRLIEPLLIRVPYEKRDPDLFKDLLRKVHALKNHENFFTLRELTQELGLSPATTRRFLVWAIDQRAMQKIGAGSNTHYQLISQTLAA